MAEALKMDKPNVGDKIRIPLAKDVDFEIGEVLEVYDDIDVWWETEHGEAKMGLMDFLASEPKASTAEWYAVVENIKQPGEVMAVASFEAEVVK